MRFGFKANMCLISAALVAPALFAQVDDLIAKPATSQQFREAAPARATRGPASVKPVPAARKPANEEATAAVTSQMPKQPEFLWTNYDPDANDAQAEGTICLTPRCEFDRGIRAGSAQHVGQAILDAAQAAAKGK